MMTKRQIRQELAASKRNEMASYRRADESINSANNRALWLALGPTGGGWAARWTRRTSPVS